MYRLLDESPLGIASPSIVTASETPKMVSIERSERLYIECTPDHQPSLVTPLVTGA